MLPLTTYRDDAFKRIPSDGIIFLPKEAGIYCILNRTNRRRYVGKTSNIYKRAIAHRSELHRGVSSNLALRRDAVIYGSQVFFFFALRHDGMEVTGRLTTWLNKAELWWVEQFASHDERYGYNHEAGHCRTPASRLRDRERKLMRGNSWKYCLLPGVDLYDQVNPDLLASWIPGS